MFEEFFLAYAYLNVKYALDESDKLSVLLSNVCYVNFALLHCVYCHQVYDYYDLSLTKPGFLFKEYWNVADKAALWLRSRILFGSASSTL